MEIQENNDEIFDIEDFISDDEDDENDTNGYENSCIYRLYCKNRNIKDEYNGSTKNLERRLDCHNKRCNNITNSTRPEFHIPIYKFIRDNGGWENWIMEKLYDYPCNSEEELTDEEDRYVRNNPNATLQGKKVKLTEQEKNNYNKDRYALLPQEKKDEYYARKQKKRQDNKEHVNKLQRENRAKKIENETVEDKKKRNEKRNEKNKIKRDNETEEEKKERQEKAQEYYKNKIENETEQEKKERLEKAHKNYKNKIENETEQEREERLEKKSEKNKKKVNCPYCNKELAYASLTKHKKICPNRPKE